MPFSTIKPSFTAILSIILLCAFAGLNCNWTTANQSNEPFFEHSIPKMKGLNFVAPPRAFTTNPMEAVKEVNANWIAVIPYAFTRPGQPKVQYNNHGKYQQWWGERPEGCAETIRLAHESDIQVLFKPQVYIPGSWPGDLDFANAEEWALWEADYRKFILLMLDMAIEKKVAAFCIGTEFKKSVIKREAFWRGLIKEIRGKYDGLLTYASNWDHYEQVPFWDALDFVGVDAYFPLVNEKTPKVAALKKAWQPHLQKMRKFQSLVAKPIVFTEYGYLSVDGAAYNTWELEGKVRQLPINQQAQANALEALYATFWQESWWSGGYIWKWFPEMKGHEGYPDRDYTPQGKTGEEIVRKWYEKD